MHHQEGVTGCECKLEMGVLMRSLVSEGTLFRYVRFGWMSASRESPGLSC
jgi:hypothetical protein